MEAIQEFYIHLDLTDVKLLYDYEHSQFIYPEDGIWDMLRLRRLFSSADGNVDDEAKEVRMRLMDPAFTAKGCLEKDKRQSTVSSEKANESASTLDVQESHNELPFRLLPVITPGETIKGKVVLDLKEDLETDNLTLSFKGGARVKIRIYTGKGYYDAAASEKYVDEDTVLWGEDEAQSMQDLSDGMALLSTSGNKGVMRKGYHEFPFDFYLPDDVREAVPPLVNSGHDYAHLIYRLKATLDKGKMMKRGNIVVSRGVWVKKDWDIAQVPDYMSPVTAEESIGTGLLRKSGRITCRASLDRKAFLRNEVINLKIEIENGDSNPIQNVSARLVLGGRARCGNGKLDASRSIHIKSEKAEGAGLAPDTVETRTFELPIQFEDIDNNLIPAGHLDDCGLIDVKYEIVIKLKRKGMHRNVEMKIPVTIGNINSSA